MDLKLSQMIEGFLLACEARRLSPHTIRDYRSTLVKLQRFLADDPPFTKIGPEVIERFMASLALPQPVAGAVQRAEKPLSKKSALNCHTGLSALWSWAVSQGHAEVNVVRRVEPPRPEQRDITPLNQEEVKALLAACDRTREYTRPGKQACTNKRVTGLRDHVIILLLLDTGMRVSEMCGLTAKDVDLRTRACFVMGKGDKERRLPISAPTAALLWRYMQTRSEARASEPLFVSREGEPLTRQAVLQMLKDLGEAAGVRDVHPHRLRHTFATMFLRNGGNVYELQMALGHTTMEMVRRYLQLAETDLDAAHQDASPVARWKLK